MINTPLKNLMLETKEIYLYFELRFLLYENYGQIALKKLSTISTLMEDIPQPKFLE